MSEKIKVLDAMKAAGKPVSAGEVVKLTDKEGNVYFYEVESMEVVE